MQHPLTAPWGIRISNSDFQKLQTGFQPQDMEDRWACSADKPDAKGNIVIHWTRSWTGSEEIALKVNRLDGGAAEIAEITWEKGSGAIQVDEKKGKELATGLCKGLLGCEWAS